MAHGTISGAPGGGLGRRRNHRRARRTCFSVSLDTWGPRFFPESLDQLFLPKRIMGLPATHNRNEVPRLPVLSLKDGAILDPLKSWCLSSVSPQEPQGPDPHPPHPEPDLSLFLCQCPAFWPSSPTQGPQLSEPTDSKPAFPLN